ncbi:uncharacterized protein LOC131887439 [Tigriopus californicus]|uniref:uncharacterized protein LOC131887439 n=1 Tax=Tigriopus californicus TaxID=6832 RepID=UPI0027DA3EE3|nr:uncharacterized protein LOC131887439 [Tigriopus californicus]
MDAGILIARHNGSAMGLTILIFDYIGLGLTIGLLLFSLVYAIEKKRLKPELFNWILISNIGLILIATTFYLSVKVTLFYEWNTEKYVSQTFYSVYGAFLHIIWIAILLSFLLYTIMAFLDRFSTTLRCSNTGWITYFLILTIFPVTNMVAVILSSDDGVSAYIRLLQPNTMTRAHLEENHNYAFALILTGVIGLTVLIVLFTIGLSVNVWCFSQRIIMNNDYNRMAFTFKWIYLNLPLTIGNGFFFRESQTAKNPTNAGFAFFPILCLVQAMVMTFLLVLDRGNIFQDLLRKRVQARINRMTVSDYGPPCTTVDELDGVGIRNHRSKQEVVDLKVTRAMSSSNLSASGLTRNNFVGAIYQNQDEFQSKPNTKKRLFVKSAPMKTYGRSNEFKVENVSKTRPNVANAKLMDDPVTPPPKPARLKGAMSSEDHADVTNQSKEKLLSTPKAPEIQAKDVSSLQSRIKPDLHEVPYLEPIAPLEIENPNVRDFNDAISQLRKSNDEIIADLNKKQALRVQSLFDSITSPATSLNQTEWKRRQEDLSKIGVKEEMPKHEQSDPKEGQAVNFMADHDETETIKEVVEVSNDTETENAIVEAMALEEERQRIKQLKRRNKAKRRKRRTEKKTRQKQQETSGQSNEILGYDNGIIYLDRDRTQDEMVTEI